MPNRKPLDGVRVIDLAQVVSGPYATMILAEQGADVIKVEPIGEGDLLRRTQISRGGVSSTYLNLNHGKRSVAVDLAAEDGRDIVLDLIENADVVVQNFRPGVVDRLGIGYEAAAARTPDIVYVSISGYGSDGPYADRPVYDPVIQGVSGTVARQKSELIPLPDLVRNVMIDKATALNVAQGVCAALVGRANSGSGDHLEISMLEVALHFFWPDGMADFTFLGEGVEGDRRIPDAYKLTQCADGQLIFFVGTEEQIHGAYRAIGRPDLCDDPRFNSLRGRRADDNLETLWSIMDARFAEVAMRETLANLHEQSVPAGPINEPEEVLVDPQVVHADMLVTWEHSTAGELRQPRNAVRFGGRAVDVPEFVDGVGESTDAILAEIGRTTDQIAALRSADVVA